MIYVNCTSSVLVSLQEDLLAQLRKMEAGAEEKEKVEVRCDGLGKTAIRIFFAFPEGIRIPDSIMLKSSNHPCWA